MQHCGGDLKNQDSQLEESTHKYIILLVVLVQWFSKSVRQNPMVLGRGFKGSLEKKKKKKKKKKKFNECSIAEVGN